MKPSATDHPLRERAAIAGIGWTDYSKNSGVSTLELALRAITAALRDCGLTAADVDGLITHGVGDAAPAASVGAALGVADPHVLLDLWGGGSMSAATVGAAAMAVATGQASTVVCWRALNARSEFRMGGTGRAAPTLVEFQYQVPYGLLTPPQQYALGGTGLPSRLRRDRAGPWPGRHHPARPRVGQSTGDDADPADHGGLPCVQVHRRAVAAVRLLLGDRRRNRDWSSPAPSGPGTCLAPRS